MTKLENSAENLEEAVLCVECSEAPIVCDSDPSVNEDRTNEKCEGMSPSVAINLTDARSAGSVFIDDSGAESMSEDPRLQQAFDLIREVIAAADQRAADELLARINGTRPLVARSATPYSEPSPDKRAPRGSAATLIDRALDEAGDNGLTVLGIQSKAKTEFEKMVSTSAIRNWLRESERKRPPRYRQVGGVWFLAGRGPTGASSS